MQKLCILLAIFSISGLAFAATAVSVSGVATLEIKNKDGTKQVSRMAGVEVLLSTSKEAGGVAAKDTSSTSGVFNLTKTNVDESVTGFWVVVQSERYCSSPKWAALAPAESGMRKAKTEDIQILDLQAEEISLEQTLPYIIAIQETAKVKIDSGVISTEQADEFVRTTALKVFSKVGGKPTKQQFEAVYKSALPLLDQTILPEPNAFEKTFEKTFDKVQELRLEKMRVEK